MNRYTFIARRLATLIAIAALSLSAIAAFTGVLLAFYYGPDAGEAFQSIEQITAEIPNGWLIRSLHDVSGNGLIAVALLQIVAMFLGRQFRLGWLTAWISGITLTLVAIALSWSAMSLDWSQLGYWRLNLELGIIKAIPLVGDKLRELLIGGEAIGSVTLKHFYALHSYILSGVAIVLSIVHLLGMLIQERENKQLLAVTETKAQASAQQQPEPDSDLEDGITQEFNQHQSRRKFA